MKEFTLVGFASHLSAIAMEMPMAEAAALERGAQIIEKEAKGYLGTPQSWWAPLAESTLANKANGNTPLLETSEMHDSIEHIVKVPEAAIGSDNMKAVWQELGTSRGIPPRSFLVHAAVEKGKEVSEVIGHTVAGLLATGEITWTAAAGAAGVLRTIGAPTSFTQAPKVISRF